MCVCLHLLDVSHVDSLETSSGGMWGSIFFMGAEVLSTALHCSTFPVLPKQCNVALLDLFIVKLV